jgi:hypothetical protein
MPMQHGYHDQRRSQIGRRHATRKQRVVGIFRAIPLNDDDTVIVGSSSHESVMRFVRSLVDDGMMRIRANVASG